MNGFGEKSVQYYFNYQFSIRVLVFYSIGVRSYFEDFLI